MTELPGFEFYDFKVLMVLWFHCCFELAQSWALRCVATQSFKRTKKQIKLPPGMLASI